MKRKPHIEAIERYLINDIDRSDFIRLDKNEFNVEFSDTLLGEIKESITSYLLQAYPSTYKTAEYAAHLLEHPYPEQIVLVSGSDFGIKICYDALAQTGGSVAFPEPTYAMNDVYAALAGASAVRLPYTDAMELDRDVLYERLAGISMLVLANPNQPTGKTEAEAFLLELLDYCREREIWVVIDEAYYSFSRFTMAKHIDRYENLVVLRSFSKSYGIAGMRLGAIISQEKNVEYLAKALPVYNVNALSLKLLEIFASHKPYFDALILEMIQSRGRLIEYYNAIGCSAYESDTNFVMIENRDVFDVARYKEYLYEHKVLIRGPWTGKPYTNAFRVSLSSLENIERLIELTETYRNGN